MSDRGLPISPMHMNGYGSHTYSLWNDQGERYWVKFHFKTLQGHKFHTNEEAKEVVGRTRESYQEALYGAIDGGNFPRWKLQIQVMPELDAEKTSFNPFDLTKVWPHAEHPMIDIGELELNRNPENYFAEVENAAFAPSNVIPGISWSPDKMLQARVFAYADAHRYRLGTHYESLPVNAPRCPVHHYHKDGAMNFHAGRANGVDAFYEPNSFGGAVEDTRAQEPPLRIDGNADRYDHRSGQDDYSQVRALFETVMDDDERERLFSNIADAMVGVPAEIKERQCRLFDMVHPDYGEGVREALEDAGEGIPKQVHQGSGLGSGMQAP